MKRKKRAMAQAARAYLISTLLVASICSGLNHVAAEPGPNPSPISRACETEIIRAAAKHNVPVGMLYSVGLTETGRRGSMQPYAMNVEGKAIFSSSAREAIERFEQARRSGAKLIDLGCMQINHHFHREKFASIESMLNPRDNVEYAARFLKELKLRHETWTMAIARYHAGPNNNPAQKRYICRVIANMVATGFGQWTAAAQSFCGDTST